MRPIPLDKSPDWRSFADRLTLLVQSEGQERFLDQAFLFINEFITVDSCAVFKVSADKVSGAQHLCTFGSLKPNLAKLLAQDYVRHGFKNDPMVQTALLSPKIRVRRLSDTQYSSSYRSQYFDKAELIDKITSVHMSKNVLFLVNFYRLKKHGIFTTDNFKDLERLAPIIGRFVLRHVRLTQSLSKEERAFEQRIHQIIHDNTQIFSKLSAREREVCYYNLLGWEEKDIAAHIGLSVNTIITHRRRIYGKLHINSKAELFRLALMVQR